MSLPSSTSFISRPEVVVCSIGSGPYRRLLDLTAKTFDAYTSRNNYKLELRWSAPDDDRPPAWAKVDLIRELLERNDIVLWLDADAIVMDLTIDIRTELSADAWMYLVRHETAEGLVPNTGVWMLARTAESLRFLDAVAAAKSFEKHKWWENAAVIHLLGYTFDPVRPGPATQWTRGVKYLDETWNRIPGGGSSNPSIKHYPGMPLDDRYRLLHADLQSVQSHRLHDAGIS